jgi:hypothetical protein
MARTAKELVRLMKPGQFFRSSASRSKPSGNDSSMTGSLITYFSLAHAPRSSSLQRSLQNGKSELESESVGFLQIGQWNFIWFVQLPPRGFRG